MVLPCTHTGKTMGKGFKTKGGRILQFIWHALNPNLFNPNGKRVVGSNFEEYTYEDGTEYDKIKRQGAKALHANVPLEGIHMGTAKGPLGYNLIDDQILPFLVAKAMRDEVLTGANAGIRETEYRRPQFDRADREFFAVQEGTPTDCELGCFGMFTGFKFSSKRGNKGVARFDLSFVTQVAVAYGAMTGSVKQNSKWQVTATNATGDLVLNYLLPGAVAPKQVTMPVNDTSAQTKTKFESNGDGVVVNVAGALTRANEVQTIATGAGFTGSTIAIDAQAGGTAQTLNLGTDTATQMGNKLALAIGKTAGDIVVAGPVSAASGGSPTITVVGAGDNSYNGTYVATGTYNGATLYVKDATHHYYWDGTYWCLGPATHPGNSTCAYVNAAGGQTANSLFPMSWSTATSAGPAPGAGPSTIVVSGAGDNSYNGTYTLIPQGSLGLYQLGSTSRYLLLGSQCALSSDTTGSGASTKYQCSSANPLSGTWAVYGSGVAPAPTVALVLNGGTAASATLTATFSGASVTGQNIAQITSSTVGVSTATPTQGGVNGSPTVEFVSPANVRVVLSKQSGDIGYVLSEPQIGSNGDILSSIVDPNPVMPAHILLYRSDTLAGLDDPASLVGKIQEWDYNDSKIVAPQSHHVPVVDPARPNLPPTYDSFAEEETEEQSITLTVTLDCDDTANGDVTALLAQANAVPGGGRYVSKAGYWRIEMVSPIAPYRIRCEFYGSIGANIPRKFGGNIEQRTFVFDLIENRDQPWALRWITRRPA